MKKVSISGTKSFVSEDHVFVTPVKLVKTVDDMQQWDKSEAYFEYLGFIFALNESVKGKSNSQGSENASEAVNNVVKLMCTLSKWIDEIPPIQQPQRFGNQAFKTWYNKLKNSAIELLQSILPEDLFRAIPEIMVYLVEGFGNSTRIDYGTGHELSFIMFLCSLFKIGYLKETDQAAIACKAFVRYLDVVRKLQITYRMEPAGSHGVWSLDDYQFVPFIWGSSQFVGNPKFETTCFLKEDIVNAYADEYMFLSCIRYINQVKSGPFAEHSNQLWSISGVPSWSKINSGLIKMYKVEVLSKFPLVQHIVFGSLFSLKPAGTGASIRRPGLNVSSATQLSESSFKSPIRDSTSTSLSTSKKSEENV
ncbi:serine/threonine-protein phosphatase 2A activator-like isoform X2 [Anoplophora glabripennis]|uniref:serine/threonine-protein phosphatase 2A activator-like isoform X2 n=1 Tax=Anoplophora glabripennis TaxID=217634 RepID=UPI000873559D|nr:serine/threonine-protein phosphatase 2A activator-like isoform X2 [Anoplophora glabripennis]